MLTKRFRWFFLFYLLSFKLFKLWSRQLMQFNSLEEAKAAVQSCTLCKLHRGRTNVVFGVGSEQASLMFIGEAPGFYEDQKGEPFVGAAGRLLDKVMQEVLGLDRSQVYITNVVKCRPPQNRDPEPDEIASCQPYLLAQLKFIKPKVICTLGNFASKTILNTASGITKVRGKKMKAYGAIVVPTFHPAAILRNGRLLETFKQDFLTLKKILEEGKEPPDSETFEQPTLF